MAAVQGVLAFYKEMGRCAFSQILLINLIY